MRRASHLSPTLHRFAITTFAVALVTLLAAAASLRSASHPEPAASGSPNDGQLAGQILPLPEPKPAASPAVPSLAALEVTRPPWLTRASMAADPPAAPVLAAVEPAAGTDPADHDLEALVAPERLAEQVIVARGDTLLEILLRTGIDRSEAHEVVSTLSTLYDPRRLRVGQAMSLEVDRLGDELAAPRLAALSLNLDFGNDLRIERAEDGGFAARTVDRDLIETVQVTRAVIDDSLYRAARSQGVADEAVAMLTKIFSYDVDFQRDIHRGDSFELIYRSLENPDGEIKSGELLYAALSLRGKQLEAYRYEDENGRVEYYDATGRALRQWLLRTPIDGARMSSGFGMRRHPIAGYNRMHRGVDFAAPTGTPIYAAGDGVVAQAGRNGGYGHYVRVRHNGEYSTAYAHMSRYAKGIQQGTRVRQGQVIGYVGSTGNSTGPHLHYEVLRGGEQINPLNLKPQTAERLQGRDLERFRAQVETVAAMLPEDESGTRLAQH